MDAQRTRLQTVASNTGSSDTVFASTKAFAIDYVRVIAPYAETRLQQIKHILGLNEDWARCFPTIEGLRKRYTECEELGHIKLFYGDRQDTLLVDMAGKATAQWLTSYGVKRESQQRRLLQRLKGAGFHFKRMDWSFDDLSGVLDYDTIIHYVDSEQVLHHFKKKPLRIQQDRRSILFGSRESDYCIRMYEKDFGDGCCRIRCEIESKGSKANALVDAFIKNGVSAVEQDLLGRLRFVEPTRGGNVRSECKTAPWWAAFCSDAKPSVVQVQKPESRFETMEHWLQRSCAKPIGKFFLVYGWDGIEEIINSGTRALSKEDRRQVGEARASYESKYRPGRCPNQGPRPDLLTFED